MLFKPNQTKQKGNLMFDKGGRNSEENTLCLFGSILWSFMNSLVLLPEYVTYQ